MTRHCELLDAGAEPPPLCPSLSATQQSADHLLLSAKVEDGGHSGNGKRHRPGPELHYKEVNGRQVQCWTTTTWQRLWLSEGERGGQYKGDWAILCSRQHKHNAHCHSMHGQGSFRNKETGYFYTGQFAAGLSDCSSRADSSTQQQRPLSLLTCCYLAPSLSAWRGWVTSRRASSSITDRCTAISRMARASGAPRPTAACSAAGCTEDPALRVSVSRSTGQAVCSVQTLPHSALLSAAALFPVCRTDDDGAGRIRRIVQRRAGQQLSSAPDLMQPGCHRLIHLLPTAAVALAVAACSPAVVVRCFIRIRPRPRFNMWATF